jgi:hypothetical protein
VKSASPIVPCCCHCPFRQLHGNPTVQLLHVTNVSLCRHCQCSTNVVCYQSAGNVTAGKCHVFLSIRITRELIVGLITRDVSLNIAETLLLLLLLLLLHQNPRQFFWVVDFAPVISPKQHFSYRRSFIVFTFRATETNFTGFRAQKFFRPWYFFL